MHRRDRIFSFITTIRQTCQLNGCLHHELLAIQHLVVAGGDALLVVARRLIVGVDNGVRGDAVGVVRLSPGVDGVDVRDILEHGATEEGEHYSAKSDVQIRAVVTHCHIIR
jgi:hypothetical protein